MNTISIGTGVGSAISGAVLAYFLYAREFSEGEDEKLDQLTAITGIIFISLLLATIYLAIKK